MMRRLLHRGLCKISLLLLLLSTAACGIAETNRISPELAFADPSAGCASALGSYALPKAYLHIIIGQTGAAPPAIQPAINGGPNVEVLRHIDPSLVFCLDYLASPLAHDTITIKKWPMPQPTGTPANTPVQTTAFLGAVSVNALDRTAYVLEALIRAAFIAASGNPNFQIEKAANLPMQIQADLEYDPFDPDESAAVNQRLTKLGFCLVLEEYTFRRRGPDVSAYCNAPRAYPWRHTLITKAYVKAEATPADKHLPGLLYRPRVPYRLEIYQRVDVGSHDPWQLIQTMYVNLENLSPVLALDIHRAAFAGRNANFVFDAGALKVACVSKTSEVEGFVDIPLQISKSIVALPGSILSVQIDQINNQTSLVKAEQTLYQVQQAYLAALTTGNYQPAQAGPATGSTYQLPNITNLPTDLAPEPVPNAYGKDLINQADLAKLCTGQSQ
jgi:Fe-S cluster biosynthesis and repair protein YggX